MWQLIEDRRGGLRTCKVFDPLLPAAEAVVAVAVASFEVEDDASAIDPTGSDPSSGISPSDLIRSRLPVRARKDDEPTGDGLAFLTGESLSGN